MEASKREGPGGGRGCHESVLRPVPCQPTNTSLKETPAKEDNAADKFCSHCRFVPAFAMRLHREEHATIEGSEGGIQLSKWRQVYTPEFVDKLQKAVRLEWERNK